MQILRKITSLSNLANPCLKGQVATLLILLMVVVLMFILVTANIGNIADLSTMLSNAADTATLQLASKLATKSRQISEALHDACGDYDECCQKTGLLGTILAIFVSIVLQLLGVPLWVIMLSAAAANAIGNYIVYGTPQAAAMGALQGAIIGLTISTAMESFGTMLGTDSALQAGTTAYTGALESGLSMMEATNIARLAFMQVINLQGLSGAFLFGGAAIYNEAVNQKMKATALKKFGEALNGLPEEDKIREEAILTSLSMTVTDPQMTDPHSPVQCSNGVTVSNGDPHDIDGDGDYQESTTCFENWYYERISNIKGHLVGLYKDNVEAFRRDFLIPYRDYIESLYTIRDDGNVGLLVRGEIEGASQTPPVDGRLIQVLRAMEVSYPPPADNDFWSPGPNQADLSLWQTCTVGNCPAQCLTVCPGGCQDCILPGYDEIDWNIGTFKDFVAWADALIAKPIDTLALTWPDWIKWLYRVDANGNIKGYYGKMQAMINGQPDPDPQQSLKGYWAWIDYFYDDDGPSGPDWGVTQQLPDCIHDGANWWLVTNPPCMDRDYNFATLDADLSYDEFNGAWYDVNYLKQMQDFLMWGIDWFVYIMGNISGTMPGGIPLNDVEYIWTDAQGKHRILVHVEFRMPETDEEEHGNFLVGEECIVLKNGSDRGSHTWVKITRTDPSKEIQSGKRALGWWNPTHRSKLGKVIKRISRASYDRNQASICGRDLDNDCDHDNDY